MKHGWLIVAAVAGAGMCASAPGQAAAPSKVKLADWTKTVALTPEGGFRMGNPDAKVKLVEYGSLTCPHCAHFAQEAAPSLRNYVRSGKVSYEYRNFVLNGIDVAATLLARCGGAKGFFPIADALYASQPEWMGAFEALTNEQQTELNDLPKDQRLAKFADIGGLYPLAAKGGVSAAEGRACLTDPAGLDRVSQADKAAVAIGVQGTPTFYLNGDKVGGASWAIVDSAIRSAGGG